MALDREFLKILACPSCRADIAQSDNELVCCKCQKKYPIKDNIPIMLIEEARTDEKKA
jgi:hypothetical protein